MTWLRDRPLPAPRCWMPEQRGTLEHLVADFEDGGNKDALMAYLAHEKAASVWKWFRWGPRRLGFWSTFLFAFLWSRQIQAVFFWNPKVRNMLSFWFVSALLLLLPPLRRRLLAPFRDDLVAAARLADLPRLAFFGQSRARVGDNPAVAVETILKGLQSLVILRGDAGLGKTARFAGSRRGPIVRSLSPRLAIARPAWMCRSPS